MANPTPDVPSVPILLLGDAGVGKSTFLSRLTLGNTAPSAPFTPTPLPTLHDLNQPFPFDIRMYNRPYRFEFSDTSSPSNYTLLDPAVIVLCYSIADPASLANLRTKWIRIAEDHFNPDDRIPIIVLGLQRDVRGREDYRGSVRPSAQGSSPPLPSSGILDTTSISDPVDDNDSDNNGDDEEEDVKPLNPRTFTYPQEALRLAQEMRCDRYCECSALTGELFREVVEDLARTAALTTTEKGGRTEGWGCVGM
ncbi:hypothetical protein KC366_g6311 [Hortaea werneckii]|uniref:Uncharacterized protein n=2 Tax=Hortaea werneckii TaxID=91943 RepID=A0A3M7HRS2_HORWE|nr:hypothetical protein KC341_g5546 [Hortaea werneckii]OTA24107.1 hypothetical protein BTJ68_13632 [Hortaea werneckii EXF-2000]KAI6987690.1 hypothetical protein KC329_g5852 [Hortaea werneckii]KAI7038820.1 hypothetical protein KC362_g6132 [Hortaea werneckii]KAI7039105.1 hypothetical protein KC366_g6311 [Hortaea werneckii]